MKTPNAVQTITGAPHGFLSAQSWDFCDKNHMTKEPKSRDERLAKRKAKQEKRNGIGASDYAKTSVVDKLNEMVTTQKKLLAVKKGQSSAQEMKAASIIIFDEDEDLLVQAAVLRSHLKN